MKKLYSLLLLCTGILASLFSWQCGGGYDRPALYPDDHRLTTIQSVLAKNYQKIETFQASGKLLIESPRGSYQANAKDFIKKPDSVYVKIEASFGIDVGILFANRNHFLIYTPMQNVYYTGPIDSFDLKKFLAFDLSYDQLVQVLLGLEIAGDLKNGQVRQDQNRLVLVGTNELKAVMYLIDPYRGVITQSQMYDQNNQLIFLAQYSRFDRIDGMFVPKTIRVQRPKRKESITFFYTTVKLNESILPKEFAVKISPKATRVEL